MLLVEIHRRLNSKFNIYEFKSDRSTLIWTWSLKYHVDLNQVARSFPEIFHPLSHLTFRFDILSIVLGGKEDDSFLVLEIPGKLWDTTWYQRIFTSSEIFLFLLLKTGLAYIVDSHMFFSLWSLYTAFDASISRYDFLYLWRFVIFSFWLPFG